MNTLNETDFYTYKVEFVLINAAFVLNFSLNLKKKTKTCTALIVLLNNVNDCVLGYSLIKCQSL